MSEDAPTRRVIRLQWGHVERNWIETTNSPILYSVLLDQQAAKTGALDAPYMLILAPDTKLGHFETMEKAMNAAQADLALRVAALCAPPADPADPVCETVARVDRVTLERSVVMAAQIVITHTDRITDLETVLAHAIDLIEGDATGIEWKRQCRAFLSIAKQLLQSRGTP